jgi:hypothetical protein
MPMPFVFVVPVISTIQCCSSTAEYCMFTNHTPMTGVLLAQRWAQEGVASDAGMRAYMAPYAIILAEAVCESGQGCMATGVVSPEDLCLSMLGSPAV